LKKNVTICSALSMWSLFEVCVAESIQLSLRDSSSTSQSTQSEPIGTGGRFFISLSLFSPGWQNNTVKADRLASAYMGDCYYSKFSFH